MRRALRVAAAIAPFVAATWLAVHAGYFRMFSFFAVWDDEGYMLVSLRSFRAIGALYTEVYSQYGPAYFVVMDVLFDALRIPVTHDTGRLVTLGAWVATSLTCGLVAWRLTRSVGLGLCAQLLVFQCLFVASLEPMHPGGLLCLLLSGIAAVPLVQGARPRLGAALLGAGAAAAVLVKINVGGFAVLAVALFFVSALVRRRAVVLGVAVAIAAVPLVLMWPALRSVWAQRYAFHVACSALAVAAVALSDGPDERVRLTHLRWCVAGGVLVAVLVCGAVLLRGTRPADLIDGVLVRPLGQAGAFTLPMRLPRVAITISLLGLASSVGAALMRRRGLRVDLAEGPLRIAVGLAMAAMAASLSLTMGIFTTAETGFLLAPLAWVAALAPEGLESPPALAIARRFLPMLAVLQTLVAYPVAGSQIRWSSFLLILLGAICVADGARQVARSTPLATTGWPRLLASGAAALSLLGFTLRAVVVQVRHEQALYAKNVPLGLPGAKRLRVVAHEAALWRGLVADLRRSCGTHVGFPTVNSLYLWAEQEPPTALNTSVWMFLFEAPLQARMVERLRANERLCGVRSDELVAAFARGRPVPRGPLVDYFNGTFVPARRHGQFTLMVRR